MVTPRAVYYSAYTLLSCCASCSSLSGTSVARVATSLACEAREWWGEDNKRLKKQNFGLSIISLPPPLSSPGPHAKCGRILRGYPPAAGFALQGRGIFGVAIQICVDNRDLERVLRKCPRRAGIVYLFRIQASSCGMTCATHASSRSWVFSGWLSSSSARPMKLPFALSALDEVNL